MKTSKLLVGRGTRRRIGAPIAGLREERGSAEAHTSIGIRVPFLHGLPTGPNR